VEALLWAVQDASDADQQKLFHDNAKQFYRIEEGTG
jgi:predicted TIM-barrel fold metal-dependent hydrolase